MDKNTFTKSERSPDKKTDKAEINTDNENWRLKQAIDLVLDHIMQDEEKSREDDHRSEDLKTLSR